MFSELLVTIGTVLTRVAIIGLTKWDSILNIRPEKD